MSVPSLEKICPSSMETPNIPLMLSSFWSRSLVFYFFDQVQIRDGAGVGGWVGGGGGGAMSS